METGFRGAQGGNERGVVDLFLSYSQPDSPSRALVWLGLDFKSAAYQRVGGAATMMGIQRSLPIMMGNAKGDDALDDIKKKKF